MNAVYRIPSQGRELLEVEVEVSAVLVNLETVASAIAEADEQSYRLCSWDERIRYESLARAAIKAMGGEPA